MWHGQYVECKKKYWGKPGFAAIFGRYSGLKCQARGTAPDSTTVGIYLIQPFTDTLNLRGSKGRPQKLHFAVLQSPNLHKSLLLNSQDQPSNSVMPPPCTCRVS